MELLIIIIIMKNIRVRGKTETRKLTAASASLSCPSSLSLSGRHSRDARDSLLVGVVGSSVRDPQFVGVVDSVGSSGGEAASDGRSLADDKTCLAPPGGENET